MWEIIDCVFGLESTSDLSVLEQGGGAGSKYCNIFCLGQFLYSKLCNGNIDWKILFVDELRHSYV